MSAVAATQRPIAGRSVLITGAARGIGAETARRLAARGARLALAGLEPELLERVAADCPGSVFFECDVTDREAVRAAVGGAVHAFGGIDVVVANAGIAVAGFARTMDEDAWERVIDVNLLGVWRTIRAALPHVIERRGYVLPIASVAALAHAPGMSSYTASKAAVEAFGDALRAEVAHLGVGVGVGYFSWIDTEMVRGTDRDPHFGRVRAGAKWPLNKTYPVADAAESVVRGIERRARFVCHPRWLPALIAARGLIQPLIDRGFAREIPQLDAEVEREVARIGARAASRPSGAGGDADARTVARRRPA
jgi:NAD(P)-dependent dehydrogenase (short-subunit alcohol dehydrogenase family)